MLFRPLPKREKRNGLWHDMAYGPCECGGWHNDRGPRVIPIDSNTGEAVRRVILRPFEEGDPGEYYYERGQYMTGCIAEETGTHYLVTVEEWERVNNAWEEE